MREGVGAWPEPVVTATMVISATVVGGAFVGGQDAGDKGHESRIPDEAFEPDARGTQGGCFGGIGGVLVVLLV